MADWWAVVHRGWAHPLGVGVRAGESGWAFVAATGAVVDAAAAEAIGLPGSYQDWIRYFVRKADRGQWSDVERLSRHWYYGRSFQAHYGGTLSGSVPLPARTAAILLARLTEC